MITEIDAHNRRRRASLPDRTNAGEHTSEAHQRVSGKRGEHRHALATHHRSWRNPRRTSACASLMATRGRARVMISIASSICPPSWVLNVLASLLRRRLPPLVESSTNPVHDRYRGQGGHHPHHDAGPVRQGSGD